MRLPASRIRRARRNEGGGWSRAGDGGYRGRRAEESTAIPHSLEGVERLRVVDLEPDAKMLKKVREYFPHRDTRRFQADLANSVYEALLGGEKNIVAEAPTGLGRSSDDGCSEGPRDPRG